ncbi:hypothetical protein PMAYCL1PPCAC_09673 [Pristionchus mayeri]|uniref:Uncharacterized protein n=1 Tax=Pristionchus mayeri TaxID=1317129 RepID=A0AAN4ZJB5_9BILA|nr:hypothetical protein PMAYCL1PPCAC_09673 [Pristionchus mayeri]
MYQLCLIAMIFAAAAAADTPCEWRGHAPFCGSQECPQGWAQLAKSSDSDDNDFAEFGNVCIFGQKTLCCKNEHVRMKHVPTCTRKAEGCPSGQVKVAVERIAKIYIDNDYYNICCDREILAHHHKKHEQNEIMNDGSD